MWGHCTCMNQPDIGFDMSLTDDTACEVGTRPRTPNRTPKRGSDWMLTGPPKPASGFAPQYVAEPSGGSRLSRSGLPIRSGSPKAWTSAADAIWSVHHATQRCWDDTFFCFGRQVINETLRVANIISGVFRRSMTDIHFKGILPCAFSLTVIIILSLRGSQEKKEKKKTRTIIIIIIIRSSRESRVSLIYVQGTRFPRGAKFSSLFVPSILILNTSRMPGPSIPGDGRYRFSTFQLFVIRHSCI